MNICSHIDYDLASLSNSAHGEFSIGIDVGSLYVSAVVLDTDGTVVDSVYEQHKGEVVRTVQRVLDCFSIHGPARIAKTGAGSEQIVRCGPFLDSVVALLSGSQYLAPDVRNVIYIGAGSFHLIHTNDDGEYLRHTSNTACASGTGAFLDQQALRVGVSPEAFHKLSCNARSCPSVATRCAVFAKTDIIHLQQIGYSTGDIAAGICRGMAESTLDVLLRGKTLNGETVVIGGVANNSEIIRHIDSRLGFATRSLPDPQLVGAVGAALFARNEKEKTQTRRRWTIAKADQDNAKRICRPKLALQKSDYPDFSNFFFRINDDLTEIALPHKPEKSEYDVVLGIDIGSTSTKGVVMTANGEPLITIYRQTGGSPIQATQFLLKAVSEAVDRFGLHLIIKGAGTTGSGRKLVKTIIGADMEMNEITAHARAAVYIDPHVDTILEIGGQDAKFTQLSDGVVFNSVMNHVCAAGTGSFIEEQAKKLGISLWEYGDKVLGIAPPRTSDRCTVFMERDLDVLLSRGWSRDEVAAAVLYSVCDNYLNKVVAGRHIGEHVYYQGATARNKALVAAFEQTLGKSIAVSPFCHLTGAIGMALLLLDHPVEQSTFRGLDFADQPIETASETCALCRNDCEITVIDIGGEKVGWGMKCGREYEEHQFKKTDSSTYDLFRFRQRLLHQLAGKNPARSEWTVAIPQSLTTFGYLPLWGTFLRELGCKVVLSRPTSATTSKRGLQIAQAEFCSPVICSHGHVAELAENNSDFIFLPHMIHAPSREQERDSMFCPYIQSHPSVIKTSNAINGYPGKILAPIVKLTLGPKRIAEALAKELKSLNLSRRQIRDALGAGLRAQEAFEQTIKDKGREVLAHLHREGEMGIVIFGRPYNVNDPGINVNLAEKIAAMGVTVIPLDFVPEGKADDRWANMYWNYGHSILRGARTVADADNLFGIFFSNFSCGPDSYILTYFKAIMDERRKPFLSVQFDAHGADTGYVTRVEAALESFRAWKPRPAKRASSLNSNSHLEEGRTVFLPPMDPIGVRFFAAAFAAEGYRAEPLVEAEESLDTGSRHVLGGECAPCPSTIGSFIKTVEDRGLRPDQVALFMPTAAGPCRFGQYVCLHRLILEKKGWQDVQLISPTAQNSYCGLPSRLRMNLYRAIICCDIMTKMILKTRPYEETSGVTDVLAEEATRQLCERFRTRAQLMPALKAITHEFMSVTTTGATKPKVGIVGEIYVRNSKFLNQDAIGWVEKFGGEALRTSIVEWMLYTSYLQLYRQSVKRFQSVNKIISRIFDALYHRIEHEFYSIALPMVYDRLEPPIGRIIELGREYIPLEFEGESILTIGRALHFIREEKVDAVINLSPTFCMPGTTTSAILARIEDETGVPIISNFYDGSGEPNKILRPHLHCLTRAQTVADRAQFSPG